MTGADEAGALGVTVEKVTVGMQVVMGMTVGVMTTGLLMTGAGVELLGATGLLGMTGALLVGATTGALEAGVLDIVAGQLVTSGGHEVMVTSSVVYMVSTLFQAAARPAKRATEAAVKRIL